jgi:hypothetical protein
MAKKAASEVKEFPVAFGKVSFGKETVSIGVSISRITNNKPNDIDKYFTAKTLTGTLFCGGAGGANGQAALPLKDTGELELNGIFDTAGFSTKNKRYSLSLSFSINSVDEDMIHKFAQRDGRIVIKGVNDNEKDEEDGEE